MSKTVMIVVPILIAATVAGLGKAGIVNIPGLSPVKKPAPKVAAKVTKPKPKAKLKTDPKDDSPPKVTGDPIKGYETVAGLWNEMEILNLLEITKAWNDEDLAPILLRMDPDKVVLYLAAVKPDRAARLTREIQDQASKGSG